MQILSFFFLLISNCENEIYCLLHFWIVNSFLLFFWERQFFFKQISSLKLAWLLYLFSVLFAVYFFLVPSKKNWAKKQDTFVDFFFHCFALLAPIKHIILRFKKMMYWSTYVFMLCVRQCRIQHSQSVLLYRQYFLRKQLKPTEIERRGTKIKHKKKDRPTNKQMNQRTTEQNKNTHNLLK